MANIPGDQGQRNVDPTGGWDAVLSKYVSVWIWSILFGTTTGLSYSYTNVQSDRPWGALAGLPLMLMLFGTMAAFMSWFYLLIYLRKSIIPSFFGPPQPARFDWEQLHSESRALVGAYQFFMISGLTRLLIGLSNLMFEFYRSM